MKSKNHHWWPVGLQRHWTDWNGDVSWIEPNGKTSKKRAENRKIGFKIHGHTIAQGTDWAINFENEFDIDNEVHAVVAALNALKPFGRTPSEFFEMVRLVIFQRNRTLRDMCKFYHIDEQTHRSLLLLIYSVLLRSPGNRFRFESYPQTIGLPRSENVGKINIMQKYQLAKNICKNSPVLNQHFVLLHSPFRRFIFGDGSLDLLTSELVCNRIRGRALVSLTPQLCVYFCTPMSMRNSLNCASLSVAPWMVDWVNEIMQIYSKDKLFFVGAPPKLTDAFRQGEFLEYKERTDALIEMLDDVAGIEKRDKIVTFTPSSAR